MRFRLSLRLWAILLLAAGYGWAGGHFIPGDAPVWAYAFQFVLLLILFVLATGFIQAAVGVSRSIPAAAGGTGSGARLKRNSVGLTIFAVLTLLINIANIVKGGGQGVHYGSSNSFADLVPIGMIIAGDVLWLVMSGVERRGGRAVGSA